MAYIDDRKNKFTQMASSGLLVVRGNSIADNAIKIPGDDLNDGDILVTESSDFIKIGNKLERIAAHDITLGKGDTALRALDSDKLNGIDAENFVKNTDYATATKAGVIKIRAADGNLYISVDGSDA